MRWIITKQSSFSESFFPVLTEDVSFFTPAKYMLPYITLEIPQELS
ncbi:nef attachable domain protein [Chlamydia psittaci C1/97]|nr:nef attachable domain protein [Chlamydia psittaci C1/97]